MDDEISLSSPGGRCWETMSGVTAGDFPQQRNGDLCRVNQSGPRAYADRHTAPDIVIEGGTVSEREEFPPVVIGVQALKEALLGPAPMGERILGSNERKRDG